MLDYKIHQAELLFSIECIIISEFVWLMEISDSVLSKFTVFYMILFFKDSLYLSVHEKLWIHFSYVDL